MGYEEVRYLDANQIRITLPEGSTSPRVEILGDRTVLSAKIKRVFPISDPESYLSILDNADKEVGILRHPNGLDKESKRVLDAELDRRYFTPVIKEIHTLKQDGGMWFFEVVTQRGPTSFYVRHWRDHAYEIKPGRWHIQSVDGQRYEIVDIDALDARSLKLLDQLL